MKFVKMLLQMDCCVRVLYGESVRREDGIFEDMEEELEWFDEPTSFNDLYVCLNAKFDGDFTLKGRFDTGMTCTEGETSTRPVAEIFAPFAKNLVIRLAGIEDEGNMSILRSYLFF